MSFNICYHHPASIKYDILDNNITIHPASIIYNNIVYNNIIKGGDYYKKYIKYKTKYINFMKTYKKN
jgi:hypothetical protein